MRDFYDEFMQVLQDEGYEPVKPLQEDRGGPWPRLRYQGERQPSGRYILHMDAEKAFATYGTDKGGDGFKTWRSWEGHKLKPEDIRNNQAWYEKKRKAQEQAETKRHARLARLLTRAYKRLPYASAEHQYLKDKGVDAHPMMRYRAKTRCLVLPVLHMDGKVYSLQYINERGDKWFHTGGKVKGGFVPLSGEGDDWASMYMVEGVSTGMTVRMATDKPVVCAFNANNLVPVTKAFRKKYEAARIIIAADNDQFPSEGWPKSKAWVNTGLDRAIHAAGHTGAEVKAPMFEDDFHELRPTDWNDFACYYGIDKVKSELIAGPMPVRSSDPPTLSPKTQGPAINSPTELTDVERKWLEVEPLVKWKGGVSGYYDDKHSVHNAILFLSYHPQWAGTFVYDEFSNNNIVLKSLPWDDGRVFKWREITDQDLTQLRALLWSRHNTKIGSKGEMNDILDVVSKNKPVHPVRDYFDELVWDGVPRLNEWMIRFCGIQSGNLDYVRRVSACFLMAAVRRVYEPGTFHKQMLVLEGKQDIGKSTLLRSLATFDGVEYFSDKISFKSIDNPYLCSFLSGRLIIEFPELKGMGIQDRNIIKAWISQTEDEMQPKHQMRVIKFPRQFVLAASTNDAGWMTDPTGGIRFWPVHCGKIDLAGFEAEKMQIWAEAVHRVKVGEAHWIQDDDPVYATMMVEQVSRYDDNIWLEPIREYVQGKAEVTTEDVLKNALHIPVERWTHKAKSSIGECLRSIGWDNPARWCKHEKKHKRTWVNPAGVTEEIEIEF